MKSCVKMPIFALYGHDSGNRDLRACDGRSLHSSGGSPEECHVVLRNRHRACVCIFIRGAESLVEHGPEPILRSDVGLGALSVEKGQQGACRDRMWYIWGGWTERRRCGALPFSWQGQPCWSGFSALLAVPAPGWTLLRL